MIKYHKKHFLKIILHLGHIKDSIERVFQHWKKMCPPYAKRGEAPESAKTALLRNFARYLRVNARLNRQITSKFGFSDLKLTKVDMSHFAHVILKTV